MSKQYYSRTALSSALCWALAGLVTVPCVAAPAAVVLDPTRGAETGAGKTVVAALAALTTASVGVVVVAEVGVAEVSLMLVVVVVV